jgi:hypothetical protein
MSHCRKGRWHLVKLSVQINGEVHCFRRAVDHEGEVFESCVATTLDRKAASKSMKKAMRRYGRPGSIVTNRLGSCGAALGWGAAGCRTHLRLRNAQRRCAIWGALPGDPNQGQVNGQYPRQGRRLLPEGAADVSGLGRLDVSDADMNAGRAVGPRGESPRRGAVVL